MHLLNTTVLKAKNIILFRKSVSLELKLHLFEFCLENGEDIYFVKYVILFDRRSYWHDFMLSNKTKQGYKK